MESARALYEELGFEIPYLLPRLPGAHYPKAQLQWLHALKGMSQAARLCQEKRLRVALHFKLPGLRC